MKYGSVCSGVEAATVAWHPLGWEPQWFSEIDKFPSAVLQHHYPETPNLGDMSKFKEWNDDPIDLLVGGTPCQSFSVAGLRRGLADPRGNLMLTYLAIAERYQPRWLVWENVPGVLSSNRGRDFGTFLGALGQLGYGFSYRVLDAQYFGVAQRRRRVFVVGHLGDWRRAAAVLFEREGMSGHPAPSREAKQETAGYTSSSFGGYHHGVGTVRAAGGDLGGGSETLVTEQASVNTITASYGMGGVDYETKPLVYGQKTPAYVEDVANCLQTTSNDYSRADGFNMVAFPAEMSGTQAASTPEISPTLSVGHKTTVAIQAQALKEKQPKSQGFGIDESGTSYTLTAGDRHAVAFAQNQAGELRESDVFNTLNTNSNASGRNTPLLRSALQVRRLTPIECERLQGFPDNYTQIPWRNKDAVDCPDGPRYKAMGNSMAVPVMRWIGERINKVEEITKC